MLFMAHLGLSNSWVSWSVMGGDYEESRHGDTMVLVLLGSYLVVGVFVSKKI